MHPRFYARTSLLCLQGKRSWRLQSVGEIVVCCPTLCALCRLFSHYQTKNDMVKPQLSPRSVLLKTLKPRSSKWRKQAQDDNKDKKVLVLKVPKNQSKRELEKQSYATPVFLTFLSTRSAFLGVLNVKLQYRPTEFAASSPFQSRWICVHLLRFSRCAD